MSKPVSKSCDKSGAPIQTPGMIKIQGRTLPCRASMGAMRRFKRLTGHEVSAIDSGDIDESVTFVYCCVASACHADGVEFDMDIDMFADCLMPEDISEFFGPSASEPVDKSKKKTAPTSGSQS